MWKIKLNFDENTNRSKYRMYSPGKMVTALQKIRCEGMSAYKASKVYGIPQSTLKDRVSGIISDDTLKSGPQPLLTMEEESRLADHLTFMASLGYGYSRSEVVDIASQYAIECGRRNQDNLLSLQWFRSFKERWPCLELNKPRSLSFSRAKAASQENIDKYFTELETILKKYDLQDKPHCLYNIDEKGINHEHTPPFVVAAKGTQPPEITSERSTNITVIGCGNAIGTHIPPFIVFQGARMRSELLDGCTPGTDGSVSPTGWSNGEIFKRYLKEHFMKYVQGLSPVQPIIVFYDGHKSHVPLELIDRKVISPEKLLPATTLKSLPSESQDDPSTATEINNDCALDTSVAEICNDTHNDGNNNDNTCAIVSFIDNKESQVVKASSQKSKQRNVLSHVVSGKAITETKVMNDVRKHIENSDKKKKSVKLNGKRKCSEKKKDLDVCKSKKALLKVAVSPKPGPSGLQKIIVSDSDESDIVSENENDEDKCCVCNKSSPSELRKCNSLVIVKWGACMFPSCKHWTHLRFCCGVNDLRRHSIFYCPCHGLPCLQG